MLARPGVDLKRTFSTDGVLGSSGARRL